MSEVDLPVLQAQVIAQGLMLRAIAKSIDHPQMIREVFADELARILPTLSTDTMGFVSLHANQLLMQFSRPVPSKRAPARSAWKWI